MPRKTTAPKKKSGVSIPKKPTGQKAPKKTGATHKQKSSLAEAPVALINETNGQHTANEAHQVSPDLRFVDPTIQRIVNLYRYRQTYHGQEKSAINRIKAILRRDYCDGDKKAADVLYGDIESNEAARESVTVLMAVRDLMKKARLPYEKAIEVTTSELPIAAFADTVRGFGKKGLGYIIAECGDLSVYPTIQGVFKRIGVAVIDGKRQRKCSNKEEAMKHNYNPPRRAVLYSLAESLLKQQGKEEKAGPYRLIYDAKKAEERPKVETDLHAHNRAMRYMSKELLKDLTLAWRKINQTNHDTV